jgi:hypothetical protein
VPCNGLTISQIYAPKSTFTNQDDLLCGWLGVTQIDFKLIKFMGHVSIWHILPMLQIATSNYTLILFLNKKKYNFQYKIAIEIILTNTFRICLVWWKERGINENYAN